MRIGIVDAELLGLRAHRFPNLVSMKLAGYHRNHDDDVELVTDYSSVDNFDRVYVSKVFTGTKLPADIQERIDGKDPLFVVGGTGFSYDNAKPLPAEIEHTMPYYDLYKPFVELQSNPLSKEFSYYRDYSIGFLTRHCFRHCPWCVNKNSNRVTEHSLLTEFLDLSRKKICLCDDNFFGFSGWKRKLEELIATQKPFCFRQGLDERLLTDEKAKLLFSAKYDGSVTFAFDSIDDYEMINEKLHIINRYRKQKQHIRFYVLCGFESVDLEDIENTMIRVSLLLSNGVHPYIMRYRSPTSEPWRESKYAPFYISLANWANQPRFLTKMSYREFVYAYDSQLKKEGTYLKTLKMIDNEAPRLSRLFEVKFRKF